MEELIIRPAAPADAEALLSIYRHYVLNTAITFEYDVPSAAEFRSRVENSKGFCMRHFIQLMEKAQQELPNNQREWFYPTVYGLMEEHLIRVKEDLDWFVGMFDYRQQGADWKNSKDAVPRTMQKLRSGYPADPPYKAER